MLSEREILEKIESGESSGTEQLGRLLQARSQARIISFDEQFVPNTNKDTLRRELYQRFVPKDVPDHEVEDLLLKRAFARERGARISCIGRRCVNVP